jgi:hypothetical protein
MKRSTPVIMGILLIVAVAGLGYLDQFHNQTNNTSSNISFIGEHPLTGHLKTVQPLNNTPLKNQQGAVNVSTSNNTVHNNTNSAQNQNSTSSNPSGS